MPRKPNAVPKISRHAGRNLVRVRLGGRDRYFGAWDDPEAHERAKRAIAEHLLGQAVGTAEIAAKTPQGISIAELVIAYVAFARGYYVRDGRRTKEVAIIEDTLRVLRETYGMLPASEFSPLKLKAVREAMVAKGWTRLIINQRIGRVKRVFKWAAENELVSASVFHGLQAVAGLRYGRTTAPEARKVLPVDVEHVNAVLPYLSPVVGAMVRFQAATGCRPGEVCQLRACDVNRDDAEVWTYRPASHKTQHHGRERVIFIGPKGQRALIPFLDNRPADVCCFSPAEASAAVRDAREANRKTPKRYGNRRGTNRKPSPKRKPGDAYDSQGYARAVTRACQKAGVPVWKPNRLRHAAATAIRREFGLEAAQVTLGHSKADVTQIYAERDAELARRVAAAIG